MRRDGRTLAGMDVLADLLERARARGGVFAVSTLRAPWGIALSDDLPLSVHVAVAGEVWLEIDDHPALRMAAGDLALVGPGLAHRLVHAPGAPALSLDEVQTHRVPGTEATFLIDGPGAASSLLCGTYRFDGDVCASLLAALPAVIHLTADELAAVRPLVDLLANEIARDAPGRATVLDRLLDVLLVQVLRIWFAKADAAAPAWYRALDHPEVGRALRLLHADPARRWRVDSLAAAVGLSRAAFARQFTARVGVAPLRYLTDWRMGLAAERLRDSDDPVGRIAHAVGYDNEFAFSVAFRRHYGAPPTAFRARLRLAS